MEHTLFPLFSANNLPSIRTQCPVTIQTKTNAEEQTSDIASAGVTRPQKPTEYLKSVVKVIDAKNLVMNKQP